MVGRQLVGGASNNIPLKVNIAGVMSIIFALSFLQIPELIYGFFPNVTWLGTVAAYLQQTHPVGAALYIVFIFFFTFFYTSFAINPNEMADNIKKNGGVIPGIRSGKPTSDYIRDTVERLSWIGALFYALIAFAPILFQWVTRYGVGYELSVGFGGTTLLIVSSAALDIVKNLEAMLLMRHYKGFLK
jgi:preprotein translocase subunit SecY